MLQTPEKSPKIRIFSAFLNPDGNFSPRGAPEKLKVAATAKSQKSVICRKFDLNFKKIPQNKGSGQDAIL